MMASLKKFWITLDEKGELLMQLWFSLQWDITRNCKKNNVGMEWLLRIEHGRYCITIDLKHQKLHKVREDTQCKTELFFSSLRSFQKLASVTI